MVVSPLPPETFCEVLTQRANVRKVIFSSQIATTFKSIINQVFYLHVYSKEKFRQNFNAVI